MAPEDAGTRDPLRRRADWPWKWKTGPDQKKMAIGQDLGNELDQANSVSQAVPINSDEQAESELEDGQAGRMHGDQHQGSKAAGRDAPVTGLETKMPGPDPGKKNSGKAGGAQCLGPQKFTDWCP